MKENSLVTFLLKKRIFFSFFWVRNAHLFEGIGRIVAARLGREVIAGDVVVRLWRQFDEVDGRLARLLHRRDLRTTDGPVQAQPLPQQRRTQPARIARRQRRQRRHQQQQRSEREAFIFF